MYTKVLGDVAWVSPPIDWSAHEWVIPAQEVSLLNNFETVTTSVVALLFYKEVISLKMWIAILFTTLSSLILSTEGVFSLHFSSGAFYVLIACFCWGFENNFTRKLSSKDSESFPRGRAPSQRSCLQVVWDSSKIPSWSFVSALNN